MWFLLYCKNILYPQHIAQSHTYSPILLFAHTINQYPQTNTNNKYITADDATPNPLAAGEEALLDAGEEAAATAMEA